MGWLMLARSEGGTISGRNQLTGQLVAEFRRGQSEELAKAQIGELQAHQARGRLVLATTRPEATQVQYSRFRSSNP